MAGLTQSISSPDLELQVKKFKEVDKIVDFHAFPAMNSVVRNMHQGWRDVAPVDTGHYRNTLKKEVKSLAGNRIIHGAVSSMARSGRGFTYPRALEESTIYHYRSTSKQGQRTAGQVVKMFKNRIPQYQKEFGAVGVRITKSLAVN